MNGVYRCGKNLPASACTTSPTTIPITIPVQSLQRVVAPIAKTPAKSKIGSLAEFVGKRAVEKAAPWKSPKAGLSLSA